MRQSFYPGLSAQPVRDAAGSFSEAEDIKSRMADAFARWDERERCAPSRLSRFLDEIEDGEVEFALRHYGAETVL